MIRKTLVTGVLVGIGVVIILLWLSLQATSGCPKGGCERINTSQTMQTTVPPAANKSSESRLQNESYFFDMNGTIEIFNGSYVLQLNNGTEYQLLFGLPFINSKFSKPPTAGQHIELMGYVKKCQLNETCNPIVGVSGWRDAPTKFDMNGTFRTLYHPCPSTGCNPMWYALILDNSSYQLEYELLFNSATKLPNSGQHIRVIGNVTNNHMGICSTNWQETPCNPIGRVTVLSWQPS